MVIGFGKRLIWLVELCMERDRVCRDCQKWSDLSLKGSRLVIGGHKSSEFVVQFSLEKDRSSWG